MSTPKNGFRGAEKSILRRTTPKATRDPVEDVFLKPMAKPWTSPTAAPMTLSSTPLHFIAGVALSPTPISAAATTRQSLDLFHKNASRYVLEQPSSLTSDFALSALKNSFSMSSLSQHLGGGAPPCVATMQTPDATARLKWERPFNSLTRLKDRGITRLQWRRSFGSSPLNAKEDAAPQSTNADWPALQADYTYLMSCDLIESCRSLNGEMSWDNGDLEHLRLAEAHNNESVAVAVQTEAEIVSIPDLQLQLQLLRDWLKRMESKVPKLILRPKWTRDMLERRIVEYKVLQREIQAYSAQFREACQRCSSWNPRLGRWLENRYHRLLLRILEWTYHLEALAKKPLEFWSGRRAAGSSPESEVALPSKHPRLDYSSSGSTTTTKSSPVRPSSRRSSGSSRSSRSIHHSSGQTSEKKMRQSSGEGGLSPPLPAAVAPVTRANMGIYEFKHPDTDTENPRPRDQPSSEEDVRGRASRKRSDHSADGALVRSNDSSENEWIYSPNTSGRTVQSDEYDGQTLSVRKKLSFDSEEDNASSSKSWYQYSSSDQDWLQSGSLELDDSDLEYSLVPPPCASADLPEESAHKDASSAVRVVYDKEKVHKLVTEAEQMVSMSGEACRAKNRKPEARYSNPDVATAAAANNNSECDASSELTSEEGESDGNAEDNNTKSSTLNRTFNVPETAEASPPVVVMRNRQRIKPQRPLSLSGLPVLTVVHDASARWAASETALNHLMSSPTMSPCVARPLMCHAGTQKDRLSPSTEGLGSSLAGLSSSGSTSVGGARQRRRRHSARLRNFKASISRRDSQDCTNSNVTLQSRLSASAASASSSGELSSGGACSLRGSTGRRIVKSSTLTRISTDVGASIMAGSQSSPLKPKVPSTTNSSPRSAPSDGEVCLTHADETSNFSEQAWDNYLEPYASEAYSEDPPDAESARRLLEFGEDYRNDLDSLSDCPSSLSAAFRPYYPPKRSPPKRPKGFAMADRSALTELRLLDSDSDVEDLVHVVETSASQYHIAVNTLHKVINSSRMEPSQYAELLATCRTNIECLQTILTHLKMSNPNLVETRGQQNSELKPVRDLIVKWVQLDGEVSPLHQEGLQQRQLQQQIQSVRNRLVELEALVLDSGVDGDFQMNLKKIAELKTQIESEKDSLLHVNVEVHSCIVQQPNAKTGVCLKEDVAGLYQMWERLFNKVDEKEALLEDADKTWKEFQEQLNNLKAEIASDQEKVKSFIELQSGCPAQAAPDAASSELNQCWAENWSSIQLSIQCDSGISSGSDGEFISLGEREKRLHTLRQLARKLETALAPGNAALMRINRTLDQTQHELMLLHNQLSHLPPIPVKRVPTPSSPPFKEISVQTEPQQLTPKRKNRRFAAATSAVVKSTRSALPYWWRIARAALPFHLALLALLIAACVMEPSCCNYLNNFGSSLVPKLSYIGGPPPI